VIWLAGWLVGSCISLVAKLVPESWHKGASGNNARILSKAATTAA